MEQLKSKKFKRYTIEATGLPKSLVDYLYWIPNYFDSTKHPLSPYLDKQIIPKPGLDILLLQNFEDYCCKIDLLPTTGGIYIATSYYGLLIPVTDPNIELLRKDYGITTSRAVLFPNHYIEYKVFIHELLHDAFNSLQDASRKKILNAAKADCEKLRQNPLVPLSTLLSLGYSECKDSLNIDELIAYFFSNKIDYLVQGCSLSSKHSLPEKFRKTLREIGYKV